jgi:hypothetical protein
MNDESQSLLSIEEIESLGWKYTGKAIDVWFKKTGIFQRTSWTAYEAILHYNLRDGWLFIYLVDAGEEHPIFEGRCNTIDELKNILKVLEI